MSGQYIEYTVIVILCLGVVIGLIQGFERTFFSWFNVVVGGAFAINLAYSITKFLLPQQSSNMVAVFCAGIFVFTGVYLLLTNLSHSLSSALRRSNVGILGNIFGAIVGGIQMIFVTGLCIHWLKTWGWIQPRIYPISSLVLDWTTTVIVFLGAKISGLTKLIGL